MGLKEDLDECKSLWRNASWLFRTFLIVTVFIGSSSIASLSETVFLWKGFIYDGINFYRLYIATPISLLLNELGFTFSRTGIDYLAIVSIFSFGMIRWISYVNYEDMPKEARWLLIIIVAFGYLLQFTFLGFNDKESKIPALISLPVIGAVYFYIPYHYDYRDKALWYAPPILSIFIVLILGAINMGLSSSNV